MAYNDEKGGRPPIYDETYHPDKAYELIVSYGHSNAKFAREFGVHRGTINKWLARHEEFRNKVLSAQDAWNAQELTQALVRRAKGFEFTETTRELIGDRMYVTKKVEKYAPPDTGALRFALTNMVPKRFSEKREVKLDTPSSSLELVINTGSEVVKAEKDHEKD